MVIESGNNILTLQLKEELNKDLHQNFMKMERKLMKNWKIGNLNIVDTSVYTTYLGHGNTNTLSTGVNLSTSSSPSNLNIHRLFLLSSTSAG